jgi:hypothetical protein
MNRSQNLCMTPSLNASQNLNQTPGLNASQNLNQTPGLNASQNLNQTPGLNASQNLNVSKNLNLNKSMTPSLSASQNLNKSMTPSLFLFLFLFLPINHAAGQLKTYITPEAGPAWDINRVADAGHMFTHSRVYGAVGGVAIWQEVMENLSIGSGIYLRNFSTGPNPDDNRPHQPGNISYRSLLIPVRIAYRIQPQEIKVGITPRLGYQFGSLTGDPVTYQASSLITDHAGVTMRYDMQQEVPVNSRLQHHMIEAGVSVDYRLPNNWQFSVSLSHYSGLTDVLHTTIDYETSDGNSNQASYFNDGSRFETTFGLNIPVSNLWENKAVRTQRKIESGAVRSATVRKLRYLYFGGDIGALWRSFSTTNPAVGPVPIDGKGIFRYSNLQTGAYIGYMFSNGIGFDAGAYYQRSATYVTLMYDHETDFAVRTAAPLFLEFPAMFRYRYDLYAGDLFLVPAAGISVITHFATGNHTAGNGDFSYSTLSGPVNGNVSYTAGRAERIGVTARAGLGVEYDIPVKIHMLATFNLSYSYGLRTIDVTEVTTSVNETPATSTIGYSGSGWNASVGVRFPMLLGKENRRCGALPQRR